MPLYPGSNRYEVVAVNSSPNRKGTTRHALSFHIAIARAIHNVAWLHLMQDMLNYLAFAEPQNIDCVRLTRGKATPAGQSD